MNWPSLRAHFEVRSMHLASTLLCKRVVMTVNIPVQEKNATCRIVASADGSTHW